VSCQTRVDDDLARLESLQQAARHRGLDFGRARDAQEHDVARLCQFGESRHFARAGGQQIGELGAIAMDLEAQWVPLGEQVPGDAVAHEAEADESDPFHDVPPSRK